MAPVRAAYSPPLLAAPAPGRLWLSPTWPSFRAPRSSPVLSLAAEINMTAGDNLGAARLSPIMGVPACLTAVLTLQPGHGKYLDPVLAIVDRPETGPQLCWSLT